MPTGQSKALVDGVNGWTLLITYAAAREIRRTRIRTLKAIEVHPAYAQSRKGRGDRHGLLGYNFEFLCFLAFSTLLESVSCLLSGVATCKVTPAF